MTDLAEHISRASPFGAGPVLLVTATEVETRALHEKLTPRCGSSNIGHHPRDAHTYYLARLGSSDVVHVQCVMGSATPGGSILSVSHAIRTWNPCAIIMVGIAFGIDETEQQIADVLVSRQIVPYEPQRIGSDTTQKRGLKGQAGPILFDRFTNAKNWTFQVQGRRPSKIVPGDLLSGEKLIDNKEFRDQLAAEFSPVVGGEMEGCGLMAAARDGRVLEWIVVKGICDFADGNKGHDKQERQNSAAQAAVSLCEHVLQSIKCDHSLVVSAAGNQFEGTARHADVFFTSYRQAVEPFFYERDFDQRLSSILRDGNVWIYGKSGIGKTIALQRAAAYRGLDCIYVDLSSAVNAEPASLLEDAFWQIAAVLRVDDQIMGKGNGRGPDYWVRTIASLVSNSLRTDTLIIIDEFSLRSQSDFDTFLGHAISLMLKLTNLPIAHRLHLAFASVGRPVNPGDGLFAKVNERIPLVEMTSWSAEDIMKLADLICAATGNRIKLAGLDSLNIDTPRALKTLLRLNLMELNSGHQTALWQTALNHKDELS